MAVIFRSAHALYASSTARATRSPVRCAGACLLVLAFEGVEEVVGAHQTQLVAGLLVDGRRMAAFP